LQNSQNAYPELSKEEGWIQKQLIGMNLQQADGDFRVAEFYRRLGHPGPAYFYYELVRRRYPNTNYEKRALERMNELRSQVEREQAATAATKDAPPASTSTAPEQGPAPRQLPAGFAPGSNPRP
jgi:outer membrane protein assembly factor BamD (BamD/ComL family)